jgi:hypothetical protein
VNAYCESRRLGCAYEQIILDFPDEFDAPTADKAIQNLDLLPLELRAANENGG